MKEKNEPKPESGDFEKLIASLESVFQELPLAYKRIAMYPDWLLLMGGGKAGTDVSFWGDAYDEEDWQKFRSVFEQQGFRFSDLTTVREKGEPPHRQGFIYDPLTLEKESANSELVLPYSPSESLEEWVDRCKKAGKDKDAIYGKFYSFPESAIKDFSGTTDYDKGERNYPEDDSLGNETYWFYGDPQPDVLDRERKKELFFDKLEQSERFNAIKQSDELKASDEEWERRLSDDNGPK